MLHCIHSLTHPPTSLQENETAGPQDGSPESGDLQEWVQKMLYLMQDSIEQHVEAAMNDS